MKRTLRQLLTDYAKDPRNVSTIEDLINQRVAGVDLDDAFFAAFDARQRSRIYVALSACAMPGALRLLKHRLRVEDSNWCRMALTAAIDVMNCPAETLKRDREASCQLFGAPARTDEFKRAFRAALRLYISRPDEPGTSETLKELDASDADFEDEWFEALSPAERFVIYKGLNQWCGPPCVKRILERRAELESDRQCLAAIFEMLDWFHRSGRPGRRFNWNPED